MSLVNKNCSHVAPPVSLSFFTASVSIILFFITVPPNLFICWTVYKEPRKHLQHSFNCLVVNLALADLTVGLVVLTISTYVHILEGFIEDPSLPVLPVVHVSYFICCTASGLALNAMAVDRYIAVAHPITYRNKINPKKTVVVSIIIWLFSIVFPSTLYFHVGFILYAFIFANTSILASLLILVFSYTLILRKLRTQVQVSCKLQMGIQSRYAKRRAFERERRSTKTFLFIFGAYFLCYTPSCVLIYVLNFCGGCSCIAIHWLRDLQYVFILLNSSFNPFLYSWHIQSFHTAMLAMLPCLQNRGRQDGCTTIGNQQLAEMNKTISTSRYPASRNPFPLGSPMEVDH